MNVEVRTVRAARDLRAFVRLPQRIYRRDACWVPPLERDVRESVGPALLGTERATREAWVAFKDGRAAGRLFAAHDPVLNARKGTRAGHLSLFEAIDDQDVSRALFDHAFEWLRARGLTFVRGPVCPAGPAFDELKGLLVQGFEHRPYVLTSYNPPYYQRLFECAGFEKELDVFAYRLRAATLFAKDPGKAVRWAEKRYGFRTEGFNLKDVESEVRAIKHVLDLAIPAQWADMVPPALEEVRAMAERFVPLVDPDLTGIARAGDEPVGFGLAIPDYNQILARLSGRLTPVAALKYLYYRRRLTAARIFIMFVVPAFRQKGVAHGIYYRIFERGRAKGFTDGEASTIGETNQQMLADIEGIGGVRYKTYRVYGKVL